MDRKIDDFGVKIGGARKDFYKNPLNLTDLSVMNENEKVKLVKRDNIWKKPDFNKMFEDGVEPSVIWFVNKMRVSINPKPELYASKDRTETLEAYISVVSKIRDHLMTLKTENDIGSFRDWFFDEFYKSKSSYSVSLKDPLAFTALGKKAVKTVQTTISECESEESKDLLGVPSDKVGEVQAKYLYLYVPFDETRMSWDSAEAHYSFNEGRKCLKVGSRYGSSFYYSDDKSVILDEAKESGYAVLSLNHRIVAAGVPKEAIDDLKKSLSELHQKIHDLEAEKNKELDAVKKSRKGSYKVPYLENIERTGHDYAAELHRHEAYGIEASTGQMTLCFDEVPEETKGHAEGQDYLDTFGFRGGEFGNWLNQDERQKSLDYGYNALKDLAVLLDISDKDISLGGNLAIAFGSRGQGSAVAHYEPMRQVINLTKMKGAGSLAHEWFHALDHFYDYHNGTTGPLLYSQKSHFAKKTPFDDLIFSLKYKNENGKTKYTDFFDGSVEMDTKYSKESHGYWQSNCEMLARAFACYIEDKMEENGIRSDYLSNHADSYGKAAPQGEERRLINKKFDTFFEDLREHGVLHKREDSQNSEKRSLDGIKKMVSDTRKNMVADNGMHSTRSNNGR